jgi:hypothetical protein
MTTTTWDETKHSARILRAVTKAGEQGMTDFELAEHLDIFLSSVNGARNRLMRGGYLYNSGLQRPSGRGGQATVWVTVDHAP